MNPYQAWNRLLVDYVTRSREANGQVFLSLDEADLQLIGQAAGGGVKDFLTAVRQEVVTEQGSLNLGCIQGLDADGIPRCLGYLVATVLAANRMKANEEAEASNYFTRLREVLDLSTDVEGRPKGMPIGAEEPLWQEWNRWLRRQGFRPTAKPGEGPKKYINYPLSQALLRDHDRDRLHQLFDFKKWTNPWDPETLVSYLRPEMGRLPVHLRKLLTDRGSRYPALVEAIHQTYLDWLTYGSGERARRAIPYLYAELYRDEDPISEEVRYYIRPRKSRAISEQNLTVRVGEKSYQLRDDQAGYFYPVIPIEISELTRGGEYAIEGSQTLKKLILPQKDFWMLVSEDLVGSRVQISGRAPELGELFTILCHEKLEKDLELLRQEELLKYQEIYPLEGSPWIEVSNCMVIANRWEGVHPQSKALRDALLPRQKLSIRTKGGLRDPGGMGWLVGYGPTLDIISFESMATVTLTYLGSVSGDQDTIVYRKAKQQTQKPFTVDWSKPGLYLVTASLNTESDGENSVEKMIHILSWEKVQSKPYPGNGYSTQVNDSYLLEGALIKKG